MAQKKRWAAGAGIVLAGALLASQIGFAQKGTVELDKLFVLDQANGQNVIRVLDANSGAVLKEIKAGYAPQFELSKDGSKLFVMDTAPAVEDGARLDLLKVYDTATYEQSGSMPVSERTVYNGVYSPFMKVIYHGGEKVAFTGTDLNTSATWLDVIDVQKMQVDKHIELPYTAPPKLYSTPDSKNLGLFYYENNIANVNLDERKVTKENRMPGYSYNLSKTGNVDAIAAAPHANLFYEVRDDGKVFEVVGAQLNVRKEVQLQLPAEMQVGVEMAGISPDGSTLYLGLQHNSKQGRAADVLMIVDTKTYATLGVAELDSTVEKISVLKNGDLMMIDRDQGRLQLLDVTDPEDVRVKKEYESAYPTAVLAN